MIRHVVSMKDFDRNLLETFLADAARFKEEKQWFDPHKESRVLATLFFEPSTRTRLSFESAMHRLGGKCIGFADNKTTSVQKGETIHDTIKNVEGYCDAIVMRTKVEGAARYAADISSVPIVNGGDGASQHPSQTLTDCYTIWQHFGKIDGLKVGFTGDLKYGRTIHSLIEALSHFDDIHNYFIPADPGVQIEGHHIPKRHGNIYHFPDNVMDVIDQLDVLYVSRLQQERFPEPQEFNRIIKNYRITTDTLKSAKKDLIILHPLPRNTEIHLAVDETPHAKYFEQAHNGVIVRKCLLFNLIEKGRLP